MKQGDVVEWVGKCGPIRARVEFLDGQWVARLDEKHALPLKDLRSSKSVRLYEDAVYRD